MANANGHGGARKGAGRPKKADKYAGQIAKAEDLIAGKDRLARLVMNLLGLADGEEARVEEKWAPAGDYTRKDVARDKDGNPILDKNGRPTVVEVPCFPDLPPDEMVLIERKVVSDPPDRQANEYLIDRILGKPTQAVEHSGEDGKPIEHVVFYLPQNGRDHAENSAGDVAG